MIKIKSGIWFGLVILLMAFLFFIISFQYSYSSVQGPGSGFFPFWLSGILMILSVWYMVETAKGKNVTEVSWPTVSSLKSVIFIIISLFVFVILFALCGFLIASGVFLFMLFWRGYKWYVNLAISVGVTGFIYWIFNDVLGVILPINGFAF